MRLEGGTRLIYLLMNLIVLHHKGILAISGYPKLSVKIQRHGFL